MQKLPQHIAIIMDGNGRWALKRDLPRTAGHQKGLDSVRAVVNGCVDNKIPVLSLFAFSSENWSRPAEEVDFLMQLFIDGIEREIEELCRAGVSLRFLGDTSQLSELLQLMIQSVEAMTAHNQVLSLNIMINYGGRWDIVHAAQEVAQLVQDKALKIDEITEEEFAKHLSTRDFPDPDLLIRTSGEQRISNFLLWQLGYSELYFTDVPWPDFTSQEFEKALAYYASRKRRYGKTNEQCDGVSHV